MNYKKFGSQIVMRLDKGEEIHEQIFALIEKENIALANVSGIGATDYALVGVYDTEANKYNETLLSGANMEILSLSGSITQMNGQAYDHLHIVCGMPDASCRGGHLMKARVSLTAEIIVSVIDGKVNRKRNEDLGINLLDFD